MNPKQTSDAANAANGKTAGTKVTGLSPRETSAGDVGAASTNPSGSTQGDSRGKDGHS